MVFAGVNLRFQAADARTVASEQHEQVFGVKPQCFVSGDDLDVRQALLIGADLILAFDDQHAARL